MSLTLVATEVLAAVPDPGQGTAPPGSAGFLTILQWAAYIGLGLGVLGVIAVGATMAVAHSRGTGGEHAAKLGWAFAGAMIVAGASGLVTAVI